MLLYGAHTATTTLPVIWYLVHYPVKPAFTTSELGTMLASYLPFLVIPSIMVLDMGARIVGIIGENQKFATVKKAR